MNLAGLKYSSGFGIQDPDPVLRGRQEEKLGAGVGARRGSIR